MEAASQESVQLDRLYVSTFLEQKIVGIKHATFDYSSEHNSNNLVKSCPPITFKELHEIGTEYHVPS